MPRGPLAQLAEQRPGRTKAPGSIPGGVHSCVTGLIWRGHWPSKPVVSVRIRGDACGPGAYEYRQAAFNRKIAGSNPVRPSISRAWESPVVGEPGCYPGRGRFDSVPRRSGPRSPAYPDSHSRGPLAQLVERPLRKREAPGSSSVGPVRRRHAHFVRVTPGGVHQPRWQSGSTHLPAEQDHIGLETGGFQSRPCARNAVSTSGRGSNPIRGFCASGVPDGEGRQPFELEVVGSIPTGSMPFRALTRFARQGTGSTAER